MVHLGSHLVGLLVEGYHALGGEAVDIDVKLVARVDAAGIRGDDALRTVPLGIGDVGHLTRRRTRLHHHQ